MQTEQEIWDERYAAEAYIFGTAPADILVRHAHHLSPASRLLLVADGEGRNGVWLAKQGHIVTSFDLAPQGVAKARKLAAAQGVTLDMHIGDVESWDWDAAPYDAVIGIFLQFTPAPMRDAMFAGMARATKPGGLLYLRGYTPRQHVHNTGGPSDPARLYTPALLRAACPGWHVLVCDEREEMLNEGPRHTGMSAFIDFVARKPG
jgi:hypothetical protein